MREATMEARGDATVRRSGALVNRLAAGLVCGSIVGTCSVSSGETVRKASRSLGARLGVGDRVGDILRHPAFEGFAHLLLPWDGRRYDAAMPLAQAIAGNAPLAVAAEKHLAITGRELPLAAGMELERSVFGLLRDTEERLEARRAYGEKRAPVCCGR